MREIFFLVLTILVLQTFVPVVGAKLVTFVVVVLEALTAAVTAVASGSAVPGM